MRSDLLLRHGPGLVLLLALGTAGCEGGESLSPPLTGVAQEALNAPYPAGPYGTQVGSVVANYQLTGYQNAQVENDSTQTIRLSDFYNPHADDPSYVPINSSLDDRLFPAGSLYGAGTPKPKALAIDVASVWCGPCNHEAKSILPGKYAHYQPLGGEFLIQLDDGPSHGTSATTQDLLNWTKKYAVDYPATVDPNRQLDALFVQPAYPTNVIVDTRTMTIARAMAGTPGDDYWAKFDAVLAGD